MSDTPKPGETVDPSKNDGTTPTPPTPPAPTVPPVEEKAPDAAVEMLRKELAQQEMRANQLANQLKAKEDADAAARAKELEEQNQFKDLYEQEKTKREAIEAEATEKEKQTELKRVKQEVLGEYNDEVKKAAEDFGFDLADTDETAVANFKEKLEKLNARAGTGKIGANNPKNPSEQVGLSGDALKEVLQDENAFHDYITRTHPGIAAMTKKPK